MNQNENLTSVISEVSPKNRMIAGLFFNIIDVFFTCIPFAAAKVALTSNSFQQFVFSLPILLISTGAVYFLLSRGYTPSKILLGRQVVDRTSFKPANPFVLFLRPLFAQVWMIAMATLLFTFALTGGAIAALFERKEYTALDKAVNDVNRAAATAAGLGLLVSFLYKFPKLVWMHDTIFQTTVIQKPYKQIFADLKFDHKIIQKKNVEEKASFKKAA
ncbi:MAG: RDD family protein [Bdellovibrio sp.]|nr:RDD family protein [Bdellovibrio sp.]